MAFKNLDNDRLELDLSESEIKLHENLTFNERTPNISAKKSDLSSGLSESTYFDSISLLDLPWEQVLCNYLLPYLSIKDLFRLRLVSTGFRDLIQTHFGLQFHVNTCSLGDHFSSKAFQIMTRNNIYLRSLCVRGAKSWLNSETILPIISSNPHLEKIDLTGCSALSGPVIYSIGVNCKYLKHLCLKDCVWLVGDNFLSFMNTPLCLEFLDLSGCWNLDDNLIVQLVQFTPSIKHLLLANLFGLTDRAVGAIAHSCPELINFSVRSCWRVTDNSIKLISHYCPKLKALQVRECRDITEESLTYLRSKKVRIDKAAPSGLNLNRLDLQQINLNARINMVL
ncbi:F-box/LRR-repeat protein 15 [Biomphalaria glabrata]|uniref:F-box/LRR-repeat protein 15-like n=1 Tax=Biomphalaria glabrata TaxID=6526 RepID=A0A9W2ZPC1_BIOGL|nr:F-box/LRR-repeat protein 15-like [Biomphalaria glabrata]XP_055876814.1 F-box/LRR-repeat protein 15-like [Biomphalaria glabrata]XP_055876815.1 F-box/LRR-repeat protein 15-like [Biomphalaria glabrata]XP_055876816.1 F-box/LRR-repeat protein 15-like [Biomphalaria glabrata]KAI8765225.1 F-box/LRR-repeat protein 15-like [Biomphalaria glabrata]KAI8797203.1 F-box/LRR-repeat protein 15 [Biomphalaria glabrata]